MPNDEFQDTGRAVDKPKGFVKWSLMAYWTAILGLAGYSAKLTVVNMTQAKDFAEEVKKIMTKNQETIDQIRVEYQNKLEARMNRLENVESRADSLSTKQNQK